MKPVYEWDRDRAEENRKKLAVSFTGAATVFSPACARGRKKMAADARSLTAQVEKVVSDSLRSAGLTTRQIHARRKEAAALWLSAA
ncbi:MAG TPA: hypothetical protein VFQ45_18780 [Longimicrobium sp.]|nr:hypothetical protein [Longimicrobium sp.]